MLLESKYFLSNVAGQCCRQRATRRDTEPMTNLKSPDRNLLPILNEKVPKQHCSKKLDNLVSTELVLTSKIKTFSDTSSNYYHSLITADNSLFLILFRSFKPQRIRWFTQLMVLSHLSLTRPGPLCRPRNKSDCPQREKEVKAVQHCGNR